MNRKILIVFLSAIVFVKLLYWVQTRHQPTDSASTESLEAGEPDDSFSGIESSSEAPLQGTKGGREAAQQAGSIAGVATNDDRRSDELKKALFDYVAAAEGGDIHSLSYNQKRIEEMLRSLVEGMAPVPSVQMLMEAVRGLPAALMTQDAVNIAGDMIAERIGDDEALTAYCYGEFMECESTLVQKTLAVGLIRNNGYPEDYWLLHGVDSPHSRHNLIDGFEDSMFSVAMSTGDLSLRSALLRNLPRSLNYPLMDRAVDQLLRTGETDDIWHAVGLIESTVMQESVYRESFIEEYQPLVRDSESQYIEMLVDVPARLRLSHEEFETVLSGLHQLGRSDLIAAVLEAASENQGYSEEYIERVRNAFPH